MQQNKENHIWEFEEARAKPAKRQQNSCLQVITPGTNPWKALASPVEKQIEYEENWTRELQALLQECHAA